MSSVHRKKGQMPKTERIIFFDLLRILCVALIVFNHYQFMLFFTLIPGLYSLFMDGYLPFNIYPLSIGVLAVYGMIFVSGAVIQYSYRDIRNWADYGKFLFRRFVRLYPAFWMSLILGIVLLPSVLQVNIGTLLLEFTGFFIFLGNGSGNINQMGWFIGTIFSLYILFPILSQIIRKYQLAAVIAFAIISLGSRSILLTYSPVELYDIALWLPLCNLFEFSLGIYIVQTGMYPKNTTDNPLVRQVSDLSFYVFLFHVILMNFFFGAFPNPPTFAVQTVLYGVLLLLILTVSAVAMYLDKKIQKQILDFAAARKWV